MCFEYLIYDFVECKSVTLFLQLLVFIRDIFLNKKKKNAKIDLCLFLVYCDISVSTAIRNNQLINQYFADNGPKNVTAIVGQSVMLKCTVKSSSDRTVSDTRKPTSFIDKRSGLDYFKVKNFEKKLMTYLSEICVGYPKRKKPDQTRLKPEIGSGSGLKTIFFRVRVSFRVSKPTFFRKNLFSSLGRVWVRFRVLQISFGSGSG